METINQIFKIKTNTTPKMSEGRKTPVDDFVVRKVVNTQEGTIEKIPTQPNDIVNKRYLDFMVNSYTEPNTVLERTITFPNTDNPIIIGSVTGIVSAAVIGYCTQTLTGSNTYEPGSYSIGTANNTTSLGTTTPGSSIIRGNFWQGCDAQLVGSHILLTQTGSQTISGSIQFMIFWKAVTVTGSVQWYFLVEVLTL